MIEKLGQDMYDCIVIGAGPAGIMAAIQAKREGLDVILIEKANIGGQIAAAGWIENLPGFEEGLSGESLVIKFAKQLDRHNLTTTNATVLKIRKDDNIFYVQTNLGLLKSSVVIVATGAIFRHLNIKGEAELFGTRLFNALPTNSDMVINKDVLIIGDGDVAFDQAISFNKKTKSMIVSMKHANPRCNCILMDQIKNTAADIHPNRAPTLFELKDDKVITHFEDNSYLQTDLVIVCIGKIPQLECIDPDWANAPPKGLYFAGDCVRGRYRHIAIACGDGVVAGIEAKEYIRRLERAVDDYIV